jgi:hypothetical protein
MELESVYDLQKKARQWANETGQLPANEAHVQMARDAKDILELAAGLDVSIGVAPTDTPKQYKLALRLRRSDAAHRAYAEKVKKLAKGEVDILFTREVVPIFGNCSAPKPVRKPLGIGSSIGHIKSLGGSVGFFAKRQSDGAIGVVSANHVLALQDIGVDGDQIIYPSNCDATDATPISPVATLVDIPPYPRLFTPHGPKTVDCAFAVLLDPNPEFDPETLLDTGKLDPTIGDVQNGSKVAKIGRTTDKTTGRVSAFNLDQILVKYPGPAGTPIWVKFVNQIEIEADDESFGDAGDSGSLVFTSSRQPVGLLFAESLIDNEDIGRQYANQISDVLNALEVDIVV